jgi:uncharacterized protein involved in exopolysaccharide biosynthesis
MTVSQKSISSQKDGDDVASANVVQNQANTAKPRQVDATSSDAAPMNTNEILQRVIEEERARATLLEKENDALREEGNKLREELKILGAGELKIRREESKMLHDHTTLLAIQLAKDRETSLAIIHAREEAHQARLKKKQREEAEALQSLTAERDQLQVMLKTQPIEHIKALQSITTERDQLQAQLNSIRALLASTSLPCDGHEE